MFIFIGGELPTAFLKACGIAFDTHFGTPRVAEAHAALRAAGLPARGT